MNKSKIFLYIDVKNQSPICVTEITKTLVNNDFDISKISAHEHALYKFKIGEQGEFWNNLKIISSSEEIVKEIVEICETFKKRIEKEHKQTNKFVTYSDNFLEFFEEVFKENAILYKEKDRKSLFLEITMNDCRKVRETTEKNSFSLERFIR